MDSIKTQHNPNAALNTKLLDAGLSKTVYALTGAQIKMAKLSIFETAINKPEPGGPDYFDMFTEAWTGKQDSLHKEFFDTWHSWASPVVDLDRSIYPHFYPTNGASEAIRQLIFEFRSRGGEVLHIFEGEYEGYKAMAEAAGLNVVQHRRKNWEQVASEFGDGGLLGNLDMFWISQPSAIDGNVWKDFNAFLELMPPNSVSVDLTYVGAVPEVAITEKFNLNQWSVAAVVFSLSKPFGAYYDRIGGVFCREASPGLFGNMWFKNLTSITLGTMLMREHSVFDLPACYEQLQAEIAREAGKAISVKLVPSDVYVLATVENPQDGDPDLMAYLNRAGSHRVCLTPGMVNFINFLNAR